MTMIKRLSPLVALIATASLLGCQPLKIDRPPHKTESASVTLTQWPVVTPGVKKDPTIEARVKQLLSQLSLEQKVAQMIQVDLAHVTPEEITQYRIGSVLNGGGQPPNKNPDASAGEWAAYAEMLYQAAMKPETGKVAIPLLWGTDAVHGHGNLKGATLYPHNIALGATGNADLVEAIAKATALEVAVSGIDWNFAPTVAVARDDRWGRAYESFSENPALVATLGAATVRGLQGAAGTKAFLSDQRVLATAKHFIGDGGTALGDDQGHTLGNEAELIKTHLPGYISAIEAGVQTVMASYSWWQGVHSHGNTYLLTDVLKGRLNFDGIVVSDWQGMAHIEGCRIDSCPQAVNAGIDLFMIPYAPDWQAFYANTLAQVRAGDIAQARIDDAVARILRVKMRARLWQKASPAQRQVTAMGEAIGSDQHRALARQAVRESLVLLKNNNVLPLNPTQRIAVVGEAAKSIATQAGGWSVTWQATGTPNAMFPGATHIYQGLQSAIKAAGGRVSYSDTAQAVGDVDAAIVVFGEPPYAEMYGDIQNLDTLEFQQHNKRALQQLKALKARGIPTVAVFLSGRPLWVNKELNAADAFVAAWLPGTEGQGVADVLLSDKFGKVQHNFMGKLPFSWPAGVCDAVINQGEAGAKPLYAVGFGLSYTSELQPWQVLPESTQAWPYGCLIGAKRPAYQAANLASHEWFFALEKKSLARKIIDAPVAMDNIKAQPLKGEAGVALQWSGKGFGRVVLRNGRPDNDFLLQYAHGVALDFTVRVKQAPNLPVNAIIASGHLAATPVDIAQVLVALPLNQWRRLTVDLNCFTRERADMSKVDLPFGLETQGLLDIEVKEVGFSLNPAKQHVTCDSIGR